MRTASTPRLTAARRAARTATLVAALVALAAAGGCGDRRAAAVDSSMAQDLAAARDGSARDLTRAEAAGAAPELHDVSLGAAPSTARPQPAAPRTPPPTSPRTSPSPASTSAPTAPSSGTTAPAPVPQPTTPAPAPAAAPVAPAPTPAAARGLQPGTVATGTVLRLSPHIRVCTSSSSVGDVFEATLASAVTGEDGATIPAGANVVLRVTGLTRSGDDAVLAFEISAVGVTRRSYAVTVVDAGGAVSGSARSPSEIAKGAGRASAEEVARFGTCVPRDGELTVTLTRGIRLSGTE